MSKPIEYYMDLNSIELISEYERELPSDYHGRFYCWLEDSFQTRSDQMEAECFKFFNSKKTPSDYHYFRFAKARYFKFLIDKAQEYKKHIGLDETKVFLQSLLIN